MRRNNCGKMKNTDTIIAKHRQTLVQVGRSDDETQIKIMELVRKEGKHEQEAKLQKTQGQAKVSQ